MPDAAAMIQAIETYCRTENELDKAGWFALFADDVVHEDPVGYTTRRGLAELESLWTLIVAGAVDLRLTEKVIARGNEAIAIMASETGPAGARRRTAPIVDHFVFDEVGKITSVRAFYDLG